MNPNSRNQLWSKWTVTITPSGVKRPGFSTIRENAARFARKGFGSAAQMRVTVFPDRVVLEVRAEGHPAHDPRYVDYMTRAWTRWAVAGFGVGTLTTLTAKHEAGSRDDGRPAAQLIIAPPVVLKEDAWKPA